jgi:hypothetical protein
LDKLIAIELLTRAAGLLLTHDITRIVGGPDFLKRLAESFALKIRGQDCIQAFPIGFAQGKAKGFQAIICPSQFIAAIFNFPEILALGIGHHGFWGLWRISGRFIGICSMGPKFTTGESSPDDYEG